MSEYFKRNKDKAVEYRKRVLAKNPEYFREYAKKQREKGQ
jgi:hypothetical protein